MYCKYFKYIFLTSFLLSIFSACSSANVILNYNDIYWTHSVGLPSSIQLKWTNTDPIWMTMEISTPSRGYVGVGFTRSGGMAGSDIALGWVDDNGKPHFKDYHGTENGVPVEDEKQDYKLIFASENENGTKIAFQRKWDTCDDQQDIKIGEDTMRLIWAWSPTDPTNNKVLHWHGKGESRGSRSIYMRTPPKPLQFPDDADLSSNPDQKIKHWDITMYNVEVPFKETHYHCQIFKFPKSDKKQHMIGYRPLIRAEHAQYIHHINVLNCQVPQIFGSTRDFMEKYVKADSMDCFAAPQEWNDYCYAFRVANGVGAEGEMFPASLGDVISVPNEETYFRLEVHYENPYGARLLDSSGIRLFYTEELRQYEVSMLFVGHRRSPFLTIPPYQTNFKISGHCAAECTEMGVPRTGIKFYSVLLHAHLRAKALILRHVRNGVELEPIAYDNHYDFNYQEYRLLSKERTLLPGDELIVECDFETVNNHTFVFGGLSTKREMCEAFIFYYPKATLIDCRSQPELYSYLSAMNVSSAVHGDLLNKLNLPYDPMKLPEKEREKAVADDSAVLDLYSDKPLTSNLFETVFVRSPGNQNLQDYMNNLDWRDRPFASSVESKWRSGPRYMHCAKQGGLRIHNKHIQSISTYEPYQLKPRSCPSQYRDVLTSSVQASTTLASKTFSSWTTLSALIVRYLVTHY